MRNKEVLIEQKITIAKIKPILKEFKNNGGFNKTALSDRAAYSYFILKEIHYLEKNDLLTEDFLSTIGQFFSKGVGNAASSVIQTLMEPILYSIIKGLGLPEGWSKFLVSALTRNPGDLMRALLKRDCKKITEIIVESIVEKFVMDFQSKTPLKGFLGDFLRNDLLETIFESNVVEKLTSRFETYVCKILTDIFQKVKNLNFNGLSSLGS